MKSKYQIKSSDFDKLQKLCESYEYVSNCGYDENGNEIYRIYCYDIGEDFYGINE